MITGTDISAWQSTKAPAGAFVGIKCTQGTGYYSPKYLEQLASGRAQTEVIIHYHFLDPGNPAGQALWFLKHAKIQTGDLIACDWETRGATEADRDAFVHAIKRALPHNKVGLYCSLSWWQGSRSKFYGDFLWIADYTYRKGFVVATATFDQYSDRPVDQDVARFNSKAELVAWSRGLVAKPPAKKAAPPPAKTAAPAPAHPVVDDARGDLQQALKNNAKNPSIRSKILAALKAIAGIR